LKADVRGVKTDIAEIKTVQSGHSKFFEEHGKRLGRVEGDIADIKTALAEILNRLPPKQ
jgi:ribosomal protein L29